jgi:hypothetical protein
METKVKIASFKDAFSKFLSFSDDSLDINILSSFSELKEKKVILYQNEPLFWCGNHHSSTLEVELYYIEFPITFFVVKTTYSEISENSHCNINYEVFIPQN